MLSTTIYPTNPKATFIALAAPAARVLKASRFHFAPPMITVIYGRLKN